MNSSGSPTKSFLPNPLIFLYNSTRWTSATASTAWIWTPMTSWSWASCYLPILVSIPCLPWTLCFPWEGRTVSPHSPQLQKQFPTSPISVSAASITNPPRTLPQPDVRGSNLYQNGPAGPWHRLLVWHSRFPGTADRRSGLWASPNLTTRLPPSKKWFKIRPNPSTSSSTPLTTWLNMQEQQKQS